jgi:hypothetical protein
MSISPLDDLSAALERQRADLAIAEMVILRWHRATAAIEDQFASADELTDDAKVALLEELHKAEIGLKRIGEGIAIIRRVQGLT